MQTVDLPDARAVPRAGGRLPGRQGAPRNFQLHDGPAGRRRVPPATAAAVPPLVQTVDGYRITLRAPKQHPSDRARDCLTATITDPSGKLGRLSPLVRRARARDLLPRGLARLLPHPRLRAVDARLHEHPRRREGGRPPGRAGTAQRRRAAAGRRDLAACSSSSSDRRPHRHRAVYAAGAMRARLAWLAGRGRAAGAGRALARLRARAAEPAGNAVRAPRPAGRRCVVVTLVSLALPRWRSRVTVLWLAVARSARARTARARARCAPRLRLRGGSHSRASASMRASSLAFAMFESYLHWRAGIGFHGLLVPGRPGAPQRDPAARRARARRGRGAGRGRPAPSAGCAPRPRAPAAPARQLLLPTRPFGRPPPRLGDSRARLAARAARAPPLRPSRQTERRRSDENRHGHGRGGVWFALVLAGAAFGARDR